MTAPARKLSEPASAGLYPALYLAIGGRKVADRPRHKDVFNPATGEAIARLPVAEKEDIDAALKAAWEAWPKWRAMTAAERGQILVRAADLIRARCKEIATVMTLEQGKVLAESIAEVEYAAHIFQWSAEEGRRVYGRIVPSRLPGIRSLVLREPVGPVAAFTPWNFPASLPARKVGQALAAGCSVILKPAEETPGTALMLYEALVEAGVPDGVVNIVFGEPAEISTHLIASPLIRKVTFTGSTAVGKQLIRLSADGVKRLTLELGGHAPVIVAKDVDLESTLKLSTAFKYRNAGQVCISATRFIVEAPIYDKFVAGFEAAAKALVVGDGLDPASRMGPMANPRRVKAMEEFVPDAVAKGAKLLAGGKAMPDKGKGFFFQPSVLADVPLTARIMNEEPFGPVAPIVRVDSIEAAITEANRLPWGLAAYAFTTSLKTADALMNGIEAGMVGINNFSVSTPETPFGGVKESGYGSEGGAEGLDPYLVTKLVSQLP